MRPLNAIAVTFVLCAFLVSGQAMADWGVPFVRVACVPEAGFFEISIAGFTNDVADSARPDAWARQGYFVASAANYECAVDEVTYKLSSYQDDPRPTGMCGMDPDVIVWLQRDKEMLLDGVVFGSSCRHEPSITRVNVAEARPGDRESMVNICFFNEGELPRQEKCKTFGDEAFRGVFPLKQETLGDRLEAWSRK